MWAQKHAAPLFEARKQSLRAESDQVCKELLRMGIVVPQLLRMLTLQDLLPLRRK
jgi:hypothetical protein